MTSPPQDTSWLQLLLQSLLQKGNICNCDVTPVLVKCPKCFETKGRSKIFRTPQHLWRHLWQSHSEDQNDYPDNDLVVRLLNEITIAAHLGIALDTIPLAVSWNMVIK